MSLRIATWNINSVRLRAGHIRTLVEEKDPDIICLQETKCPDEHFPAQAFEDMGYGHIHISGMKGYNGVAVLSRLPLEGYEIYHRTGRQDCRHIAASFKAPGTGRRAELHCLYVPAGGDEPDPEANDKFAHKLEFVDEMRDWFAQNYSAEDNLIAVGDFNIAPFENDVWSHKQLLKVVSHTPVEVEKLKGMQDSLDWVDAIRDFVPLDEKCYTWWSYRNRDWKKSNRGRRLDHIWVTPPLRDGLKDCDILTHARDWDKPSDHVPVCVDLDL